MRWTISWLILLPLFAACEVAPYTHRSQFILLDVQHERELGVQAYQESLREAKLQTSGPELEMIRRVGKRIAPVADMDLQSRGMAPFDWEFSLIAEDQTVNAWALPGGKVAFYTGILPICQNEAGIAAVMGHEIAHALARHGAERISLQMPVSLVAQILETGLAHSNPENQEQIMTLLGIGTSLGTLKYSRVHEEEADHIGLMIMAKAGYDPREAVKLWERMDQQSSQRTPEFLSTHPNPRSRIENLKELMPQALPIYQNAAKP